MKHIAEMTVAEFAAPLSETAQNLLIAKLEA